MEWLKKIFGSSKPAAPALTATLKREGSLYVLRIAGEFNKATLDKIHALTARDIEAGTQNIRLLVVLSDFRGWKRGDDWADLNFFAQYESAIARIAVVGEPRWEQDSLLFLGANRRTGVVKYFAPDLEAQARAWVTA